VNLMSRTNLKMHGSNHLIIYMARTHMNAPKFVEHACMATMRYGREIDVVHVKFYAIDDG
jgi:hypothetical protein